MGATLSRLGREQVVAVLAFALGSYHLLRVAGVLVPSDMDVRGTHLMLALGILFLSKPGLKGLEDSRADRWIGVVLALVSIAASVYILSRWKAIAFSGGLTNQTDGLVGLAMIVLVFEAARRGVGLVLSIVALAFFLYPFVSPYLPGPLNSRGYGLERIAVFLTTTQGIYGIPIRVSADYIILFTIFGAFLARFGAGDFFFALSRRLTRNLRAAGAKTAVVFSTFLGMISGSAAGNVAVTGTLTIPMMKREGYAPHEAGAIEAVVSTGGQIMPPVMGAAAFIMAEIIGRPYVEVMTAALIPALLFFVSIFCVVHLKAARSGLLPPSKADLVDLPSLGRILLDGVRFMLAFATLIALMLHGYSPFKACFVSLLVLLGAHLAWRRRVDRSFFVDAARAISEGAIAAVPIAAACAAAGIISGVLAKSGLGSKISTLIEGASAGIPLVALALTMVAAIILGLGLPTTAAYLVLATVVAPALTDLGVPLLTAHMFVFFYGCVSTITPPVALAAYVAAGIAGADINRVGWTAFAYGITCYVLPFMFFFGPALLASGTVPEIALAVASGLVGVLAIASGVIGHLTRNLGAPLRVVTFIAGLALLHQGLITDAAGLAALVAAHLLSGRLPPVGADQESVAG